MGRAKTILFDTDYLNDVNLILRSEAIRAYDLNEDRIDTESADFKESFIFFKDDPRESDRYSDILISKVRKGVPYAGTMGQEDCFAYVVSHLLGLRKTKIGKSVGDYWFEGRANNVAGQYDSFFNYIVDKGISMYIEREMTVAEKGYMDENGETVKVVYSIDYQASYDEETENSIQNQLKEEMEEETPMAILFLQDLYVLSDDRPVIKEMVKLLLLGESRKNFLSCIVNFGVGGLGGKLSPDGGEGKYSKFIAQNMTSYWKGLRKIVRSYWNEIVSPMADLEEILEENSDSYQFFNIEEPTEGDKL